MRKREGGGKREGRKGEEKERAQERVNLVIRKVPGSIPAENTSPQIHMDLST